MGKSRTTRRKERVKKEVSIRQLLADFGYPVHVTSEDREEQFPCDFHGDGVDNTPSARVYTDNTVYCFVCDKTRDSIEVVREKLGIGFMEALDWLEKENGLPPLSFDPEDYEDTGPTGEQELRASLVPEDPFVSIKARVQSYMNLATEERVLPLSVLVKYWDTFDRICYMVERGGVAEEKGKKTLWVLFLRFRREYEGS